MQPYDRPMKLHAAIIAATLLSVGSCLLLWWADEASDAAAIAAGTGLVVGGALFGLTLLAWRWRRGGASYVDTGVGVAMQPEYAVALDPTTEGYASDDSGARAAVS